MSGDLPDIALELRSLVTSGGTLELSLHDVPVPAPDANEVLVRVEASPINPSDLGLLIASADMTTATVSGTPERPIVTASLGEAALGALSARLDKSLPVGNEGAGTVVAAGSSPAAQALIGRTVAIAGGAMYSQYRAVDASACLRPARRGYGKGRGIVLRQSDDGTRNDRKPCAAKDIPASCTPRRRRTSARCWSSSARKTGYRWSISSASPSKRSC